MSLPTITESELKNKRHAESASKDLVMFYSVGCTLCNYWEEQVEQLISKYPQINFVKLVITDVTLPICAPPVVPSLVAFDNGYRTWEALGSLQNTGPLEVMIDEWIAGSVSMQNVSGGQFISP